MKFILYIFIVIASEAKNLKFCPVITSKAKQTHMYIPHHFRDCFGLRPRNDDFIHLMSLKISHYHCTTLLNHYETNLIANKQKKE